MTLPLESPAGLSSPPAADGASTPAKAAAATMPETAGASPTARKARSGAPTSRRSKTKRPTSAGKTPAPASGPPSEPAEPVTAPEAILRACRALQDGTPAPLEIFYLRGPAELKTALHELQLDGGLWVLARFIPHDEPQDGRMAAYRTIGG